MGNGCYNCLFSKSKDCPWEGTYHHKDENGNEIGICNAWKKRELKDDFVREDLGMPYLMKKVNWFENITDRLRDYSEGDIWTTGDEILCKTEEVANALADMFECLYKAHGENILVNTGYYDPIEDERNGEVDRYTGWWYVNIG